MPAKDRFHEAVKVALLKDGWTITDEPLTIAIERLSNLYIDLGAEKLLIAEREGQKLSWSLYTFGISYGLGSVS